MFIPFIKKYVRVLATVLGIMSGLMTCDFVLLVTSLGFHWWHPFWGASMSRGLLVYLVAVSTTFSLLYVAKLPVAIKAYRRLGYTRIAVQKLITSIEVLLLLTLISCWGLLVLTGQRSSLPLLLLGIVWVGGFIAFTVLTIYDLRRGQRQTA